MANVNYREEQAKQYNLTEKESIMLSAFIEELYAEEGFSDVSPQILQESSGISRASYKGVLGSLAKKGILHVMDKRELGSYNDIVYLTDNALHPTWYQEKLDWTEWKTVEDKYESYQEWYKENRKNC
tara:strand:- start:41 stop:421 length:381 start_codon:yes stop_codon:yes gene_type:complete